MTLKEELTNAKNNLIAQLLQVRVQKEGMERELEKIMFSLNLLEQQNKPKADAAPAEVQSNGG